jgi:L-threonylcarbamoyladenylate synthase
LKTELLSTDSPARFREALLAAARLLKQGEVVAVPTETVYGLAANALNPSAVARIFEVKGRPSNNPLIVHVSSLEMARQCAARWTEMASRFSRAFWPGPLTLVLEKSGEIPGIVTAGGNTVGIRWPSHPFIASLIAECGFPLAAPSANLSNQVSPTSAEHVLKALDGKIPLTVDGGHCNVGIESTVVDLTCDPVEILRPGIIHAESLEAVAPVRHLGVLRSADAPPRSPGMLRRHYSPRARLIIRSWHNERDLNVELSKLPCPPGDVQIVAHTVIPAGHPPERISVIPHDPEAFARALYAELHRCDETGAKWIIVEALPEGAAWDGIRDRLDRAAAE